MVLAQLPVQSIAIVANIKGDSAKSALKTIDGHTLGGVSNTRHCDGIRVSKNSRR